MYIINGVAGVYEERESKKYRYKKLHNLITCHNIGCKNVLFVSKNKYDMAERYRVDHIFNVIDLLDEWNGFSIELANVLSIDQFWSYIDLVVLERTGFTCQLKEFITRAHKHNIPVIYEVDDLVYNVKYLDAIMEGTGTGLDRYDFWIKILESQYNTAVLCDGYWTTNLFLSQRLANDFKKQSWVLPNFANPQQIMVSETYLEQKLNEKAYCDDFVLGYFSGSSSHNNDFMEIAHEIYILMRRYPNIYLKIVGFLDLPSEFEIFESDNRIIRRPFMDCCSLQKEIAEVDVNLVPLVVNEFTNCKSEIKYFEAALVGTISCMSPTYVYKNIDEKGYLGKICEKGKWLSVLEDLYVNRHNLKNGFKQLHEEALADYAYYNQAENLKMILDEMESIEI